MENHVQNAAEELSGEKLATISLAALGIVFGDIGTSPLYAIRECFHGEYGIAAETGNVLGVLSLIIWALLLTHPEATNHPRNAMDAAGFLTSPPIRSLK